MNAGSFTALKKYIRVRSPDDARFVEFDFAIGDPSLYVELVLPPEAFAAFCKQNDVIEMNQEQIAVIEDDLKKWRFGYDTLVGAAR